MIQRAIVRPLSQLKNQMMPSIWPSSDADRNLAPTTLRSLLSGDFRINVKVVLESTKYLTRFDEDPVPDISKIFRPTVCISSKIAAADA